MKTRPPKVLAICGETGVGKTRTAVRIARRLDGEIVNADSMQVYRGMDIGTAKPTPEEQAEVPFHCIDVADPHDTYSAGRFREDADRAVRGILARGKVPVIAGGTGLYLKVLVHGMIDGPPIDRDFREAMKKFESESPGFLHARLRDIDPKKAGEIPAGDTLRLIRALEVHEVSGLTLGALQQGHRFSGTDFQVLKLGIRRRPEDLKARIEKRVGEMIRKGFADEVRRLMARGLTPDTPSMSAVGYREMMGFLKGETGIEEAVASIAASTLRLAKRQRTWFRADKEIRWFRFPEDEDIIVETAVAWYSTKNG